MPSPRGRRVADAPLRAFVAGAALIALSGFALVDDLRTTTPAAMDPAAMDRAAAMDPAAMDRAAAPDPGPAVEVLGAVEVPAVRVVQVIAPGCGGRSVGSGVVLGAGRVLTARHVLDGSSTATVVLDTGEVAAATVVAVAPDQRDGALLDVPDLADAPTARVATDAPQRGSAVTAAGFARGPSVATRSGPLVGSLTSGPLSIDGGRVLTLDLVIDPGMSGGPVLDAGGAVFGIAVGFDRATRTGIAVPIDSLDALLDGRGDPPPAAC